MKDFERKVAYTFRPRRQL